DSTAVRPLEREDSAVLPIPRAPVQPGPAGGGSMRTRRDVLKLGGSAVAGFMATQGLPRPSPAAQDASYPVVTVAPLTAVARATTVAFAYPDANSPAVLIRLGEPAPGGVGPNQDIVAYSVLCTHKGCA